MPDYRDSTGKLFRLDKDRGWLDVHGYTTPAPTFPVTEYTAPPRPVFKVGQKVRVKPIEKHDLPPVDIEDPGFNGDLELLSGREDTVSYVTPKGRIYLDDLDFAWLPEWLEPVSAWIPVAEKQPPQYPVLGKDAFGNVWMFNVELPSPITHWTPIPE